MKVRIQPRDTEVPQDDPFRNDLLGRRESIEVLTSIVRSIDGPCTLAVDAPWGAGKTTFIRIWTQVLCEAGFPVVSFNAWETDFSNDPFVALSEEITRGLGEHSEVSLSEQIKNLRNTASEVATRAVPALVRVATAGILDINPLLEKEVSNTLASYTKDRLAAHVEAQKSLQSFRATLQDTASALAKKNSGLPLVIFIDELDRCRPSYAVELLEVAKHLFAVDHIVFVLTVNRSELAHSVSALYGNSFDAPDYLKRFFDLDFRLPEPSRKNFIESTLDATRFDEYFSNSIENITGNDQQVIRDMLLYFLGVPSLSIRTIGQTMQRLGLVFASLRRDKYFFGLTTVVVLIIRTVDLELYQRFIRGEASDKEIVDTIFRLTENKHLRETYKSNNPGPRFESLVIQGCKETLKTYSDGTTQVESTLLKHYAEFLSEKGENVENESPYNYASRVREYSTWLSSPSYMPPTYGFKDAIRRVELISEALLGNDD